MWVHDIKKWEETYEIGDDTAVGDSASGVVEEGHTIRPTR